MLADKVFFPECLFKHSREEKGVIVGFKGGSNKVKM